MKDVWWLSFADPNRPVGQKFLGVCIVRADDLKAAMAKCWMLGINPGGEVQGTVCLPDRIPDDCYNRLIPRTELIERKMVDVKE